MATHIPFTKVERRAVGKSFLAFRKKNRLNQKELSALMGMSQSTVCTVETTLDPIAFRTMKAFEDVEEQFRRAKKLRLKRVPRVEAKGPRFNRGAI